MHLRTSPCLKKAAFLLTYANSPPLSAQQKADLMRFAEEPVNSHLDMQAIHKDYLAGKVVEWVISKYDKHMTQPMDSLIDYGWLTTRDLKWSKKGKFASKTTHHLPVFTSKFNTVVDHVFWLGSVTVESADVLWALSFAVGKNGEAKSGEQHVDVRNGFTDHNGLLVTVNLSS